MATIVALDPESLAELEYGPPAETHLTIVAVNEAGEKMSLTLGAQALRQLASVLREIEAEHPGATKGH
jgi:hypothetical protein